MNLIDTHAHIQFKAYEDSCDHLIEQAGEEDCGILVVGCELESSQDAVALAQGKKNVWAAVGQHPTDTDLPFDAKAFYELGRNDKVVAVGECGLDYYRLPKEGNRDELISRQRDLFKQHIELAHELNKPLIIHCRDSHEDMVEILVNRFSTPSSHPHPPKEHGVLHCFTGTAVQAQSYLDLNFLISFTGIITFADQYDDVVRLVPLEKMLIETDSPFLTPGPHRGKKNSPLYVRFVAQRIAELKEISFEEVARVTTKNAQRLFRLAS